MSQHLFLNYKTSILLAITWYSSNLLSTLPNTFIRSKNRMDKEHVKYSIKEYNKYLLSLIGIFVLLLTGIISYNYTNTSLKELIQNIQEEN